MNDVSEISTYRKELTGQAKRGPFVMKQPTKDELRARIAELERTIAQGDDSKPAAGIVFAAGMFAGMFLAAIGYLWPAA